MEEPLFDSESENDYDDDETAEEWTEWDARGVASVDDNRKQYNYRRK